MTQEQAKNIRVSELPKHIQETAAKLDTNQDGELQAKEVIGAITDLHKTSKTNKNLKNTIAVFVVLTALLVASIFGVSVAAARLAKDVTIDQETGFAMVRGSSTNDVMKTEEAIIFREVVSFGGLSNQELANLKILSLQDGDLQFDVKGYARNSMDDTVVLLVEGGTLTYDNEGITSSTGDARFLLEATFGPDVFSEGSDGQRRLFFFGGRGGFNSR